MARTEKPVDVVMIGLGWTNAIMAMDVITSYSIHYTKLYEG